MDKILSQNEIDALLRGIEDGKVDLKTGPADLSGVMQYDFSNQDRIIRGRMPTLEIVSDHFCRLFRNTLSSTLRKMIDVCAKGVQMVKFGEFIRTLPVPTCLNIFKMEPLRGHALLVLESKLVFTLLDVFFGGSGRTNYKVEGREFTTIESKFIQKIVTLIFGDFEKAWQSVCQAAIQYVRSEINPQFVSIVPPGDLVIIISFGIELDQVAGTVNVCIPYSVIEPIKSKLHSGFQSDQLEVDRNSVGRLVECLKNAEVEITVELGKRLLAVRELLNLKVGDTLLLDKEATEPLVAKVQDVPKFLGKAGLYGTNKAIQIEGRLRNS